MKNPVWNSLNRIAAGVGLLLSIFVARGAATPAIIPLPVTMQSQPGTFTLHPMQILADPASQATAQYLAAALSKSTGYKFELAASAAADAVPGAILITTANPGAGLGAEGYELTVTPDHVVIRAPEQAGAFYGVQSLLQLLPPQIYSPEVVAKISWEAPCVSIRDYPQFPWRGLMLDASRHFISKGEIKQMLDAMAMHKLNTFHWHLVDDQGWRLEITKYPNLTATGAWREGIDYGLPPRSTTAYNARGQYGGFYTQADAREIVAYAQERHITVVPEIDLPCHAAAGLASYPQFGSGNPTEAYHMDYPHIKYGIDLYSLGATGTMDFFKEVLNEVIGIFPSKYIHCGGDEVTACGDRHWLTNPDDVANMKAHGIAPDGRAALVKYQHWLSTTLSDYVRSKGRMMMGWTEIENAGVIPHAALMDWESGDATSKAVVTAKAGLPVVMSFNNTCYLNYVEGSSNSLKIEPPFFIGGTPRYLTIRQVYDFNPVPTNLPAPYVKNIIGAQCSLWGEYVPSFRNVMFKVFPRETAMAETTWTPRASLNYSSFTNRLEEQKQRFAQMGINYDHERVPQIGQWGPSVATAAKKVSINITRHVTAPGEIDVSFWRTKGPASLAISSVALLENGVQVDIDRHVGVAGASAEETLYIVHLSKIKPRAKYTIEAVVAGKAHPGPPPADTVPSGGNIYLPNWN